MTKRSTIIIICVIAAVMCAAAFCIIAFSGGRSSAATHGHTESKSVDRTTGDFIINFPETDVSDENNVEESENTEPEPNDESILVVSEESVFPVSTLSEVKEPTGEIARPVAERTPAEDVNGNDSGMTMIGNAKEEPYNCGTPGHYCNGPETHAYVLNLEREGCPYCGEHSCTSFYATDEWGNTCYTPSKCQKYDIHKDPVFYCPECGRPTGDGSNGTCVQYVESCICPICGIWVESRTCHIH